MQDQSLVKFGRHGCRGWGVQATWGRHPVFGAGCCRSEHTCGGRLQLRSGYVGGARGEGANGDCWWPSRSHMSLS